MNYTPNVCGFAINPRPHTRTKLAFAELVKLDYQSPNTGPAWRISVLLWVGLGTLVLGTGPLIIEHLFAPSINDIGTGMLAGCTFWPAVGLTVAGTIITLGNRRRAQRQLPPLPGGNDDK